MAQHEEFLKIHEVQPGSFPRRKPLEELAVDADMAVRKELEKQLDAGVSAIRKFDTGATRDTEAGKNDYEGYLSPLALFAFGNYMTKHRRQPDGSLRDSDNWQKGISLSCYMKSLWRHLHDLWSLHRDYQVYKERVNNEEVTHVQRDGPVHPGWVEVTVEDACCAIWFNVQGYLHEYLKQRDASHPKTEVRNQQQMEKCLDNELAQAKLDRDILRMKVAQGRA